MYISKWSQIEGKDSEQTTYFRLPWCTSTKSARHFSLRSPSTRSSHSCLVIYSCKVCTFKHGHRLQKSRRHISASPGVVHPVPVYQILPLLFGNIGSEDPFTPHKICAPEIPASRRDLGRRAFLLVKHHMIYGGQEGEG